jgi:Ca2+-binding RTX toxin-like protein
MSQEITNFATAADFATNGDDIFSDTENASSLIAQAGNDAVAGFGGNDTLDGGLGNDTLNGNIGDDTVSGLDGNDSLYGGQNNDQIDGGSGSDFLSGDLGDDTLIGGVGDDTFSGGAGADTFDISSGQAGDEIVDFEDGSDVLSVADGVSFQDLQIQDSDAGAVIANSGGETLAVLNNISASLIGEDDFVGLSGNGNGGNMDDNGPTLPDNPGGPG